MSPVDSALSRLEQACNAYTQTMHSLASSKRRPLLPGQPVPPRSVPVHFVGEIAGPPTVTTEGAEQLERTRPEETSEEIRSVALHKYTFAQRALRGLMALWTAR